MYEIQPKLLWIGNAHDIREPGPLFDTGIAAVVDVAYEEVPSLLPRQMIYCRFPLNDGGGNELKLLLQTVQTLLDLLAAEIPTIVACSAGMSRSPTIVSFALAAHLSQLPEEVIERISKIRSLEVKPELWNDVGKIFGRLRRIS